MKKRSDVLTAKLDKLNQDLAAAEKQKKSTLIKFLKLNNKLKLLTHQLSMS